MTTPTLRTIFLGSPPFATRVFERLVASPFAPVLLVTPPDRARGRGRKSEASPLVASAAAHGIDVLQPATVKDDAVVAQLRALEPDLFLVVSYGELLREAFLELPRLGSLNVHPSLLPRWRGATPIQGALLAGDEVTGTSIQRMVLALDAGDIVEQRELAVAPGETAGALAERLAELSGEALVAALTRIAAGTATFRPQNADAVTITKKLEKSDGILAWTQPAIELERRVRAMHPWPGAATTLPGGDSLRVWEARVVEGAGAPGTVLANDGRLVVATGSGALELTNVQASGKRALDAASFLRGRPLELGTRLGDEVPA